MNPRRYDAVIVGAVANMAPDLFLGIIANVPFVDVLNTILDDTLPLTPPEWPEWGNPIESAEAYEAVAAEASGISRADAWIRAGNLGEVLYLRGLNYKPRMSIGSVDGAQPVPRGCDYNLWCGPAPMKPFYKFTHPMGWRAFMEYGNGTVGDMGVHMFDMVRWMLDLGAPKRISSAGQHFIQPEAVVNIPDTQVATWDYDDLQVTWQHRYWGPKPDPKYRWGATIYGEKVVMRILDKDDAILPLADLGFLPASRNQTVRFIGDSLVARGIGYRHAEDGSQTAGAANAAPLPAV